MSGKAIVPGDMVAFPIESIYVTAQVTRLLPKGFLVKTTHGLLHDVVREDVVPCRDQAESDALVRRIAGMA